MKKQRIALLLALGLLAGCSPADAPAAESPASSAPQAWYEQVTLYLPNENADGLTEKTVQVEKNGNTVIELVEALVGEGALPEGTEVIKWSTDGKEPPAITVDLSEAFAEGILNQGTAGETATMAALVNTIWAYYEPAELTLTAGGRAVETGHNLYDAPFTSPMTLG